MSDSVSTQFREIVLERLRELTSTRNIIQSPEDIENYIMNHSNGVKKTYMNMLSKVMNLTGDSSGTDSSSGSPTVIPSNARPVVSGVRAGPGLLPSQQQQSVGSSQIQQQHHPVQVVHIMPLTSSANASGTSSVTTTHNPPQRSRLQASPSQLQSTIVNQAASTTGYLSMDPNGQRITVQPGVNTTVLNQIPPRPGVTLSMVGSAVPVLTASSTGGSVSQPVIVYTTQSGSQLTTPVGQQPTGSYALSTSTGQPFTSSIQGAPATATHTGNYQTENYGGIGGSVTVLRPVDSAATNVVQPAITLATGPVTSGSESTPAAVSSQSRSVRASAGLATSIPMVQQMGVPSANNPAATGSGGGASTSSSNYRASSQGSGGSHSKQPAEPLTLEMRAQIVSGLSKMASRYLPAVRRAIHVISEQAPPTPQQQQGGESTQSSPQSPSVYLRKYVKLKEILENPDTNLTGIRPDQLNCIEKLLSEIERNPMHLLQTSGLSHRQQAHHSHHHQQQTQHQAGRFGSTSQQHQQHRLASDAQARISGEQQAISMQSQQISPQSQTIPPGSGSVNRFRGVMTGGDQFASIADSCGTGSNVSSSICRGSAAIADTQEDVSHPITVGQQQPFQQRLLPGSASFAGAGALFPPPGIHDFSNSLRVLADEFKQLTNRAAHSETGAEQMRRLRRAISEIALETKPFRELHGLLLAQDLLLPRPPARLTSSHPIDAADYKMEPAVSSSELGGDALQKEAPVDPDEDIDRATPPTRKRQLSVCSGLDEATVDSQPKGKRLRTSLDPNSSATCHEQQPAKTAFNKETEGFSGNLFLDNTGIPDDPQADPLITFPVDQLERLNPRILSEVDQIRQHLRLPVEANGRPPPFDVMETYSTCIDYGEWNASCHLVIGSQQTEVGVQNSDDPIACLPCSPPPLFVRLSPDYLMPGTPGECGYHMNWYYPTEWSPEAPEVGVSCLSNLSDRERAQFMQLCYQELNRTLGCRSSAHHRPCHRYVSLYQLARAWLDCLCAAMARFVKFDENIQTAYQASGTFRSLAF